MSWDSFYAAGSKHVVGTYPHFEKLVRDYVVEAPLILELGAGLGQNIPFLSKIGSYHGIEGSSTAVDHLHSAYPNLKDKIACGDFTRAIPFSGGGFDLVVDRASLPHNDLAAITNCADLIYAALKPGGLFIASDWFSDLHSEATRGEQCGGGSRCDYVDGQFAGVGIVHFSSESELRDIFHRFDGISIQERITRRPAPGGLVQSLHARRWISAAFDNQEYLSSVWDFVVRKPK